MQQHTGLVSDAQDGAASSGKRRLVRKPKDEVVASSHGTESEGAVTTSVAPPMIGKGRSGSQIVNSQEDGNALIKRVRQLEGENSTLSNTVVKICDENVQLTGQIADLQQKVVDLAQDPLTKTSVLHSLFEPEKSGWFGGSKAAARAQLEQLTEALQTEFMTYKANHASSNEEVQALMTAVNNAHTNASQLSKIVQEQQQAISAGPLSVNVRVIPVDADDNSSGAAIVEELKRDISRHQDTVDTLKKELKKSNDDLKIKCTENIKLQNELKDLRDHGVPAKSSLECSQSTLKTEVETQKLKDENNRLRQELEQVRHALTTEEQLHALKKTESEELSRKVDIHKSEVNELKRQLADSLENSTLGCVQCERLRKQCELAQRDAEAAARDLHAMRLELANSVSAGEKSQAALQAQLIDSQNELSQAQNLLRRTVPLDQFTKADSERTALVHELELSKKRIAQLDAANDQRATDSSIDIDETEVLTTLARNKERISRLEFERDQLQVQLQQANDFAVSKDQEAQRVERASSEDKQRVAFLIKKCASITAELRSATAERDSSAEECDKQRTTIKQLQRQVEENAALQQRVDELSREQQQTEARVASTQEIEEKLVKAKETIAYMELAQTRTINMSQYAELQAAKDKLEHTVEPLRKQLDESQKEVERLRALAAAQQTISGNQHSDVRDMKDKVNSLTASEAKQREKVASFRSENERLTKINNSLEAQMADMQDGIREMAIKMDHERTTAKATAEANARKEIEELRAQVEKQNTTLAHVQATKDQFVPEALYHAVVQERDHLTEEINKKNFEMEKLKSEIFIYRQTITELETENDEHVKEIEALQDRYQNERTNLSERLATEQKKTADFTTRAEVVEEESKKRDAKVEEMTAIVKELEQRNAKQTRAFEDKCRSEEHLNTQLAALQKQVTELRGGGAQTSSPKSEALNDSAAATKSAEELYKLQCQNERLEAEIKRLHVHYKSEAEEDQRAIGMLQMQLKSRMPADLRSAYEAELNLSTAMKKSNEHLQRENEALRKMCADGGKPGHNSVSALSAVSSNAEELQMKVIELHRQLELQKEGYGAAMSHAVAEAESKEARIVELESQLTDIQDGAKASEINSVADTLPLPEEEEAPKKKVKKVKKKKSLAEQVATTDDADDFLGGPLQLSIPQNDETVVQNQLLQSDLLKLQKEVEALRRENVSLKSTVDTLTQELKNSKADLDDAVRANQEMRAKTLEEQRTPRADSSLMARTGSNLSFAHERTMSNSNRSFSRQNIQELDMQLRCLKDDNERLMLENRQLQNAAAPERSQTQSPSIAEPSMQDLKRLRKLVKQKDAEIKSLVEQLMPTKNKLVEYMAMADRLGLQYPFPTQLEGPTVMRLRALKMPDAARAASAPSAVAGAAPGTSPAPRPPRPRRRGAYGNEGEEESLR